jgi:imidazolonepropionase-like amidohydrolase
MVLVASTSAVVAQDIAYFTGATVIDGVMDRPISNATLVVRSGKIVRIQTGPVEVPAGAAVVDLAGRYVIPGLIDAHVHINDVAAAERALESGVTTARSMGVAHFADVGLRELARAGRIRAPEIVAAGYHVRPRPAEELFQDAPELGDLYETPVRGAAALERLVSVLVRHEVNVIKTNATERAGLPQTDPRKPLFDQQELEAIVRRALAAGLPVAAHAHGDTGGRAAVLAGVRSIEHGTYLSAETLALMAERGTYLVPTIAVVRDLTQPGGDYDSPVLEIRGRHMLPRIRQTAREAHRRGVRIVAATDTGYGPNSVLRLSHELIELVDIGLSPLDALRSATTAAAELLGVDDHTGRIAADFDADFIVLDRNPLDDIGAVQDALMVVSDGVIVVNRLDF